MLILISNVRLLRVGSVIDKLCKPELDLHVESGIGRIELPQASLFV